MNSVKLFIIKTKNRLKNLFRRRVYLDYASVTPAFPFVYRKMSQVARKYFTNPSSIYARGVETKNLLDKSRKQITETIEVRAEEIIFTGSGTEANNLAIKGVLNSVLNGKLGVVGFEGKPHIVISSIEHPSIRELLLDLQKREVCDVSVVSVGVDGLVDLEALKKALTEQTILVSIMYVNNEIGSMNDVKEIAKTIRHFKKTAGRDVTAMPYFHTDASQAFVHANMRIPELGVDLLTLDGGKCYGPRGIGILYKKTYIPLAPEIIGGGQESGFRSGTENLPSIVGLADAMTYIQKNKVQINNRVEKLHDYLVEKIKKLADGNMPKNSTDSISFNSQQQIRNHPKARQTSSPHIVNICLQDKEAEFIVFKLDVLGVEVSSVTSCQNLKEDSSSYVISAVGKPECSKSSLRISIGIHTKKSDIDRFLSCLTRVL